MARGSISVFPPIGEDVRSGLYPPTGGGSTGTGSDDNFWLYSAGILAPEPLTTTPLDEFEIVSPFQVYNGGAQLSQTVTITDDNQFDNGDYGAGQLLSSPAAIKYDAHVTQPVVDVIVGPLSFNSYTNPWVTGGATYGEMPEGPRGMLSLEGTTQWDQADHPSQSGSAPPLFNIWYTFKNAATTGNALGSNALTQLTYQALADGASIGVAPIPDVIAPNVVAPYNTTTFRGYWGWMFNPWHGTINGGQLAATNAQSIGFLSEAMFMGNTQWGTLYDFCVREAWMANGLGSQSGITPTLDTHVGLYMQPLTAATSNLSAVLNNPVLFFDQSRTFTSNPVAGVGIGGLIGAGSSVTLTLNYSNPLLAGIFTWHPHITLASSANSLGFMNTFYDAPFIKNANGVTANFADVTGFFTGPSFQADGATITMQSGRQRGVWSYPTYDRVNSGSFSGTVEYAAVQSNLLINAGVTVTNRYGIKIDDATGSGSLTNQYGIHISALTKGGTTNVGIHSAAAVNVLQLGSTTQPSGGEFKIVDNGSNNLAIRFYKVAGEAQPVAEIGMVLGASAPGMYLGPGGSTVYDVSLSRTGTAALGITAATTITGALTVSSTVTAQTLLQWTRSGTLTASQTFAQLTSSWTYATTASMINTFLNYAPTQTWTVAPLAGIMDIVYQNAATYINGSASAINFSGVWSFLAGYIKTIDTQTGRNVGTNLDYQATPTYNVANSGTFTAGSWKGFAASPTINGTGCTMSSWTNFESGGTVTLGTITAATAFNATGYAVAGTVTTLTGIKFADATGAGTVTNQIAVDIPAMTKGGTLNIGMRIAPAFVLTPTTVTVASNAGTVPVTCNNAKFTNSSAANMTVTMAVTNAQDGQVTEVRIFDATGVTKTITWINTENGYNGAADIAPPANSKGSTTLPTYARFMFNGATSKWTCVSV